jgi:hypothetical protein
MEVIHYMEMKKSSAGIQLNDYILLKAIYDEQLHNAILAKDQASIEAIVNEYYTINLKYDMVRLETIDTDRLYKEHIKQLKDKDRFKKN